jgi:hypothetical protein
MLDSVKLLTNVVSANLFDVVPDLKIYQGNTVTIFYIRLWQSDRNERFIPISDAVVTVDFMRSNTVAETPVAQTVTKTLTKSYPTVDRSIWQCDLTASDVAAITTGGFRVKVTQGTTTPFDTYIYSKMSLRKVPNSDTPLMA